MFLVLNELTLSLSTQYENMWVSVNTRHRSDVGLALVHRLRRWTNVKPASDWCLVFAGMDINISWQTVRFASTRCYVFSVSSGNNGDKGTRPLHSAQILQNTTYQLPCIQTEHSFVAHPVALCGKGEKSGTKWFLSVLTNLHGVLACFDENITG